MRQLWIFIFLASCNNEQAVNKEKQFPSKGEYNSKGLETGHWAYLNKNGEIIEEGVFDAGIRVGKWEYNIPYVDSLNWLKYFNTDNSIKTNIPDFLTLNESNDSVAIFKDRDSMSLFNLIIGKGLSKGDLSSYEAKMYNYLNARKVRLRDTTRQLIETTTGNKYLYNYVDARDSSGHDFYLFNIVSADKNGKLIEVVVRCDPKYENRAHKVFFSIIPNLFVDSTRFMLQNEDIKKCK